MNKSQDSTAIIPIGINVVIVAPSLKARNAFIRAIQETGGPSPVMKSDSVSAKRAHYAPMVTKVIINTASPQMHQKLGHHSVVAAIEVDDRVEAANRAKAIFEEEGFEAEIFTQAEPEFPDGFLTFVSLPEFGGISLMFWPKPVDVEKLSPEERVSLPKREPWTENDLES